MDLAKTLNKFALIILVVSGLTMSLLACAQSDEEDPYAGADRVMTAARMGELVQRIDADAVQDGNSWFFDVTGLEAMLVYDIDADRMRVVIPIDGTEDLDQEELIRLMQANFDSALDARYAIAHGQLWGVFIHPLSSLTDEEFVLGIGQTANVVASFGSSYSSGMFIFGGGDSGEIERKRFLDELRKQTT